MTAPYAKRAITLTFTIGAGAFGDGSKSVVTVSGLRVQAEITHAGQPGGSTAILRVYGLPLSQMNQLSTLGFHHRNRSNLVSVSAGDPISGISVIFTGLIVDAISDFGSPPEMALTISAVPDYSLAMKPVAPSSYPGATDVATIMGQFAQQAGLTLENNGVSVKLSNPYFPGTALDQIKSCAKAANIECFPDHVAGTLAIWPRTGNRSGDAVQLSAQTGMIGYPSWQRNTILIRSLFNPAIKFGAQVSVTSAITPASGSWKVVGLDYALESELPDGAWEMLIQGVRIGNADAPGRTPVASQAQNGA